MSLKIRLTRGGAKKRPYYRIVVAESTAPRDGKYLVRIFGFPATPDGSVRLFGKDNCVYRLTLTTGPFVDRAWPLAVERAKPGEVELIGWNIPPDKRKAAVPIVKNEELAFVQPPGFASGTFVRVEPHACVTEGTLKAPATFSGRVNDDKGIRLDLETIAEIGRSEARESRWGRIALVVIAAVVLAVGLRYLF